MTTLDKLLKDLAHLKEAEELLDLVIGDLGYYSSPDSTRKISNVTLDKLRNYFDKRT